MTLALDRIRLLIPEHVITRVVDDTTVVLDVNTGRSFTLDPVGTRVWTLLVSAPSAQAAYDTLLSEFVGDPSQVRADLEKMIEQLTTNRLLSVQAL
jgi:Coenzyme PQQ synthesis protein D (PqqD)